MVPQAVCERRNIPTTDKKAPGWGIAVIGGAVVAFAKGGRAGGGVLVQGGRAGGGEDKQ
jgi:hypothetical protein